MIEGMGGEPVGWSATVSLVVMDGRKDVAEDTIRRQLREGVYGLTLERIVKLEPIYRRHRE